MIYCIKVLLIRILFKCPSHDLFLGPWPPDWRPGAKRDYSGYSLIDTGYIDTGYIDTGYIDTGYIDTGYIDASLMLKPLL